MASQRLASNRVTLGIRTMKKLRIGYQPLSKDLSHPGDRRRVVYWAKNRGHTVVTDFSKPVDVILLSERANLSSLSKESHGAPIIFDLVDAYFARESIAGDWIRGISKVATGQLSGTPKPFTKSIESLCSRVAAVICSSPEQKSEISNFSDNVHVILDSHDELPMVSFGQRNERSSHQLLWEGMPATMGGLKQIQPVLEVICDQYPFKLQFVTNESYFLLLDRFFKRQTASLLQKNLKRLSKESTIESWSTSNLISSAKNSDLAIIPIKLASPLQYLKPENRLLIMWRLGLPCLTSASPSYVRVSKTANTETVCETEHDWNTKITQLLKDVTLRESVVYRGQNYIREFHNADLLLEKWDKAFMSVL